MRARVGGKLSKPDKMGIKVKKKTFFRDGGNLPECIVSDSIVQTRQRLDLAEIKHENVQKFSPL